MILRPPRPTLFPYPTLSRSQLAQQPARRDRRAAALAPGVQLVLPNGLLARDLGKPLLAVFVRLEEARSEEHTSELQSRHISYAVFCLKKKIYTFATPSSPCC